MAQRPFASHTVQFHSKWSENSRRSLLLRPLALEPLASGRGASITTILIQMPHNQTLSFGCVLSTEESTNQISST